MNKLTLILILLLSVQNLTIGQTDNKKKIQTANKLLENKDYEKSLTLFRELHSNVDRKDSSFSEIVYGFSASLFYAIQDIKKKEDWKKVIELSNEFINVLEVDKDFLDPQIQEKKYWAYKDFVVAYFGLGHREKAKQYQDKLYDAYKKKELPEGINEFYNFEMFVFNNQNVWGYENYAQLGDKETEGSFSKHIYYIYSRDQDGNDKDQIFTLETVKVHKLNKDEPDFVLTKVIYGKTYDQLETIWSYTFDDPVDYEKLHNAVIAFLKGGVKTDSKSIIRH